MDLFTIYAVKTFISGTKKGDKSPFFHDKNRTYFLLFMYLKKSESGLNTITSSLPEKLFL